MENVFSKASGGDSLIEIKRLFKIGFSSLLVFLLQGQDMFLLQGQDVGCQVGNVCFGSDFFRVKRILGFIGIP